MADCAGRELERIMARFQQNPFPGVNIAEYPNWPKVTLPNGETYYEVPGHPGYVYDPTMSNATGDTVFRANPRDSIKKQQEEEDRLKKAQDQQSFNQSPLGQILPVAAGTGGLIAASQIMKPGASLADKLIEQQLLSQGAGAAGADAAASGALGAGGFAESIGAPAAYGGFAGPGAVAGEAGVPIAADAGVLGTGLGVLPLAGIAAGTYLAGKGAWDEFNGKKPNLASRATLDIATGGLNELALPYLMHKSTRDVAKGHTNDLLKVGKDDANYQNYVSGMREQFNSGPPDPSKPFAGKYGSWDEYQKAGLEANDLTGVYGNIKTYGPEWANLTQEQRQAVTQANIDSGLYKSNKGEVEITDQNKAIENKDNVLKGFNVGAKTAAQAAAQGAAKPIIPAQTIPVPRLPAGNINPAPVQSLPVIGNQPMAPGGLNVINPPQVTLTQEQRDQIYRRRR